MTPAYIVCYPSILSFTAISDEIPFKIAYADKKNYAIILWGCCFGGYSFSCLTWLNLNLLITFANSSDSDQAQQNVRPDLDSN